MGGFRGIDRRKFLKAGAFLCGGILAGPGFGFAEAFRMAPREPSPGFRGKPYPPGFRVRSGDTVLVETGAHLTEGMVQGTRTEQWIRKYVEEMSRRPRTHVLASGAGPIFVEDAAPGDILQVEFLEILPAPSGFHIRPEPEDPASGPVAVASGMRARWYRTNLCPYKFGFLPDARIPLRPFAGAFGVQLPGTNRAAGIVPGDSQENLGCRELTAGTVLYVPVRVEGAAVAVGNPCFHEESGREDTAAWEGVSRGMALRMTIRKDLEGTLSIPLLSAPAHWVFLAVRSCLREAERAAAGGAARFLEGRYGLSPDESRGCLCTRAGRRIERRIDGAFIARVLIPKSITGIDL